MKVEAIRLFNFMAFEDTGWIELRPITLLFGRNSSGKSAIIRALLLLKQSLDAVDDQRPLVFDKENGLVDLGNFKAAVHRQDLDRSLIFGFRCDLTGEPTLDDIRGLLRDSEAIQVSRERADDVHSFELLIGFGLYEGKIQSNLLRLTAILDETDASIVECVRPDDVDLQLPFVVTSDVLHSDNLDENTIGLHPRDKAGFWTTFAKPIPESFKDADKLLSVVQESVSEFLTNIVHLGPIRPQPERTYVIRDTDKPHFERDGLPGWYRFLRNEIDERQSRQIGEWMKKLGLADLSKIVSQKYDPVGSPLPVTLSQINLDNSDLSINIKDVGYGASQVLPVIASAILSKPESLVIIEQPELHLHTSSQIEIGDLFVKSQRSGVRFLLESHSEHLLLRFQRLVARNELLRVKCKKRNQVVSEHKQWSFKPAITGPDVAAVFVNKSPDIFCCQLEIIAFQNDGQLKDPSVEFQDFFQQDYDEVNAILDLSAQLHKLNE